MAFYSPDAPMGQRLESVLGLLQRQRRGREPGALAITWLRCPLLSPPAASAAADQPRLAAGPERIQLRGTSWQGATLQDPGGLVALPALIAVEQWLRQEWLQEEPELRRALEAMVRRGSVDALSYVLDRLSGTTSGPALLPPQRHAWERQRLLPNGWLASLGWPELEAASVCHKLWAEGPYGREREFLGSQHGSGNRLSSDGLARLLTAVIEGSLVSPPSCRRMCALLQHTPSSVGWLGRSLPAETRSWGLASSGAAGLQEALYAELPGGREAQLLVVLATGSEWREDPASLAELGRELLGWQPAAPSQGGSGATAS